jgi:hypothetical protein
MRLGRKDIRFGSAISLSFSPLDPLDFKCRIQTVYNLNYTSTVAGYKAEGKSDLVVGEQKRLNTTGPYPPLSPILCNFLLLWPFVSVLGSCHFLELLLPLLHTCRRSVRLPPSQSVCCHSGNRSAWLRRMYSQTLIVLTCPSRQMSGQCFETCHDQFLHIRFN